MIFNLSVEKLISHVHNKEKQTVQQAALYWSPSQIRKQFLEKKNHSLKKIKTFDRTHPQTV